MLAHANMLECLKMLHVSKCYHVSTCWHDFCVNMLACVGNHESVSRNGIIISMPSNCFEITVYRLNVFRCGHNVQFENMLHMYSH